MHALHIDKLRKPGINFWSAWDGAVLHGCGPFGDYTEDPQSVFMTIGL